MDLFNFGENNFGSFGGFGDSGDSGFGVNSSDFFLSSKERKEEKKKAEKAEKDAQKKAEQEKVAEKKKAEAKAKAKDMDIPYPFVVIARGFRKEYEGEGTIKISEVWDNLLEEGYDQFKIDGFKMVYHELSKTVYVSDGLILSTPNDTLVKMEDGVTVADGMLKATFEIGDFEGMDEDEISVGELIKKWVSINPNYEGCTMHYDPEVNVAYPVFSPLVEPSFIKRKYDSYIKEGCLVMESYDSYQDARSSLKGLLTDIKIDNVSLKLLEGKRNFFVSYDASSEAYTRGGGATTSNVKTKKVEEKYSLPLTVFVTTWGATHELTSEDFGGKEKITKEELKKVMKNRDSLFGDSSRRMDTYYDKENNRLSVMFIKIPNRTCGN